MTDDINKRMRDLKEGAQISSQFEALYPRIGKLGKTAPDVAKRIIDALDKSFAVWKGTQS